MLRWIEASRSTPILLALDDLHWADEDSMALVSFLVRRIASLPVAIIATLRPWPPAGENISAALERDGRASVQRLRALTVEGAAGLLADRVGRRLDEGVTRDAWLRCAGNPLLLEQVALEIRRGGRALDSVVGNGSELSHEPLLVRFAGLPTAGFRFAQAASVFGTRFLPGLVSQVARMDQAEAEAALQSLWRGGLVRYADNARLEFVHPLFAGAAYEHLGPLRAAFHERAFDVLLARGMEAEAAAHALPGRLVGNQDAWRLLEKLGRQSHASGALAAAAEYLRGALDLTAGNTPSELLMSLAEVLLDAGHLDEAADVLDRLLSTSELEPDRHVKALLMLATVFEGLGAHELAAAHRAEAIALAEGGNPAVAIEALVTESLAHWFAEGPVASTPLLARARELACRAGPADRAKVDWALGFVMLLAGDPAGVGALERAASPVVARPWSNIQEAFVLWGVVQSHALALMVTERFTDCQRVSQVIRTNAEQAGTPQTIGTIALVQMYTLIRTGRLKEAHDLAESIAPVVDLVPLLSPCFGAAQANVVLHAGLLEESGRLCRQAEAEAVASREDLVRLYVWDTVGHRELREGRPQQASDAYLKLEAMLERMGLGEPCLVMWGRHAVEAHLASDRSSDARRVLEWLERRSASLPCRWPRIASRCGRAWLAEDSGSHADAEACFGTALSLHDETEPMPLEKVETLLAYGSYLRRAGQPARARPLLASAVELAERVGARWLAGHAQSELRVAGGRRHRRGTASGRFTAQERRVMELAASGLSNREIAGALHLSVNTIETHLRRTYHKLGIHSRRQLIARQRDDPLG